MTHVENLNTECGPQNEGQGRRGVQTERRENDEVHGTTRGAGRQPDFKVLNVGNFKVWNDTPDDLRRPYARKNATKLKEKRLVQEYLRGCPAWTSDTWRKGDRWRLEDSDCV